MLSRARAPRLSQYSNKHSAAAGARRCRKKKTLEPSQLGPLELDTSGTQLSRELSPPPPLLQDAWRSPL